MNIMHNKTEKFITQLRHATRGERRNNVNVNVNVKSEFI